MRKNRQQPATKEDRSKDASTVWAEVRSRRNPLAPGKSKTKARKRRKKRAPRDHYSVASYRRAIHRACDLAGVERWSPNRLRHDAAMRIGRELDIEHARAVLGHSDADTTAVYADRDHELARLPMEKLG